MQSGLNENISDHRFVAPEIQWPEEHDAGRTDKILVTKESDVYGIGMVVYTVSFHRLVSSGPRVKSHVDLLPGPNGERAVLRMQQYYDVGKDSGRGTSPKTIWD